MTDNTITGGQGVSKDLYTGGELFVHGNKPVAIASDVQQLREEFARNLKECEACKIQMNELQLRIDKLEGKTTTRWFSLWN